MGRLTIFLKFVLLALTFTCSTGCGVIWGGAVSAVSITLPSVGTPVANSPFSGVFSQVNLQSGTGALGSTAVTDFTGVVATLKSPMAPIVVGNYLYAFGAGSLYIQRVNLTSGQVTKWAGNGSASSADGFGLAAQVNCVSQMSTDGTSIYFGEDSCATGHLRAVQISNAYVGTVSNCGGSGVGGTAVDSTAAYVFTTGHANGDNGIYKIKISDGTQLQIAGSTSHISGTADGVGTSSTFSMPAGVVRVGGTLFVTDGFTGGAIDGPTCIRAIDIASTNVTTIAGVCQGIGYTDGPGATALFHGIYSITSDGSSFLYVGDVNNNVVRRVSMVPPYTVTTLAGSLAGTSGAVDGNGTSARFNQPYVGSISGNNLYLSDYGNHTIRVVNLTTNEVTVFAGRPAVNGSLDGVQLAARAPNQMTADSTYAYWADSANHRIQRINMQTQSLTTLAGSGTAGNTNGVGAAAQFKSPHGVASDGTYIYVADTGNHTIRQISISSGSTITMAGSSGLQGALDNGTGTSATFSYPNHLTYYNNYLYITDTGNQTIRQVSTSAPYAVTTSAGTAGLSGATNANGTAARFLYPTGITNNGVNLYVSDENQLIRQILIAGPQTVSTLAGGVGSSGTANGAGTAARFNFPRGLSSDNTNLYVADFGNDLIREIVIGTQLVSTLSGTASAAVDVDGLIATATVDSPLGLVFAAQYGLFFSNTLNIRLLH